MLVVEPRFRDIWSTPGRELCLLVSISFLCNDGTEWTLHQLHSEPRRGGTERRKGEKKRLPRKGYRELKLLQKFVRIDLFKKVSIGREKAKLRKNIAEKLVVKRGKNTYKIETIEEKKATLQGLLLCTCFIIPARQHNFESYPQIHGGSQDE